MRACFHGHEEAALLLYRWHAPAFKLRNYDNESCSDLAAAHERLGAELTRLERIRKLGDASRAVSGRSTGCAAAAAMGKKAVGEFLKPSRVATRKPSRAASLDEYLNPAGTPQGCGQSGSAGSTRANTPLRSSSSSSCTVAAPPKFKQQQHASVATFKAKLRSSSPSVQQPLTVSVESEQQQQAPTSIQPYRTRQRTAPSGLSKRPSVDSGINLQQHAFKGETVVVMRSERKDAKTVPKNMRKMMSAGSSTSSQSSIARRSALDDLDQDEDLNPDSPIIDVEGISDDDELPDEKKSRGRRDAE